MIDPQTAKFYDKSEPAVATGMKIFVPVVGWEGLDPDLLDCQGFSRPEDPHVPGQVFRRVLFRDNDRIGALNFLHIFGRAVIKMIMADQDEIGPWAG